MSEYTDAICKEWTGDHEYVIHPAHSWVGAASDPPWCNNCGETWTPRHHTVADTLAAEDRVRAEDGHIGGRL